MGTALLTGLVWIVADAASAAIWLSVGIAFVVGFVFRMIALYRGWEEPLAKEPRGTHKHDDGRPLLGRKLQGKSQRELKDLGLVVEPETMSSDGKAATPALSGAGDAG